MENEKQESKVDNAFCERSSYVVDDILTVKQHQTGLW